jgi:uncharacterized protein with PIN domain
MRQSSDCDANADDFKRPLPYARARHYGQQLLFKGSDFSKTDIEPA